MISAHPDKGHSHRYYCLCILREKVCEAIKAGDLTGEEGNKELRRVEDAMRVEWSIVYNRYTDQVRERRRTYP